MSEIKMETDWLEETFGERPADDFLSSNEEKTEKKKSKESKEKKIPKLKAEDLTIALMHGFNSLREYYQSDISEFTEDDFKKESEIISQFANRSDIAKNVLQYVTLIMLGPMLFSKFKTIRAASQKKKNLEREKEGSNESFYWDQNNPS